MAALLIPELVSQHVRKAIFSKGLSQVCDRDILLLRPQNKRYCFQSLIDQVFSWLANPLTLSVPDVG